ncbi:hypothetical protein QT971_18465 [Microcoleus sp. herbarium19]|uniref:hypothetical protein n=1 Tax=unclassified Microcoleus TaxID=2642155 RepID=UPI002FD4A580
MKGWQVSARLHLALVVGLAGSSIGLLALPVRSQESVEELRQEAVEAIGSETVETLSSEADVNYDSAVETASIQTKSASADWFVKEIPSPDLALIATETQGDRPIDRRCFTP